MLLVPPLTTFIFFPPSSLPRRIWLLFQQISYNQQLNKTPNLNLQPNMVIMSLKKQIFIGW